MRRRAGVADGAPAASQKPDNRTLEKRGDRSPGRKTKLTLAAITFLPEEQRRLV
jgi:hypothetical protein